MAFTIDYVDLIPDDHLRRSRPLDQRGGDCLIIAHHSVSRTLGSILSTFKSKDRIVTANYAIGPLVAGVDDYKVALTVRENEDRAYTTSSSKDDIAITFEMADLVLAPPWPVGNTGLEILVELILHANEAYGMPIDRYHVTCHREVYTRGWGSYATACPGDHLHSSLDWAVDEALRRKAGGGSTEEKEDTDMRYINVVGGGSATVGEFSFTPYSPETHGDSTNLYRISAAAVWNGIDVDQAAYDATRQDALNRHAAFLADIRAASSGIDPAVLKEQVKQAVAQAIEESDPFDDIDVGAIVHGVADELGTRLGNG